VKALHWHIDYLRPAVQMEDIWFTCNPAVTEHAWAETFRSMPGAAIPLPGFGSSDCRCAAHLFFFSDTPGPPIKSLRFRPDSADGD
jgi:Uri superfamily endonuclease